MSLAAHHHHPPPAPPGSHHHGPHTHPHPHPHHHHHRRFPPPGGINGPNGPWGYGNPIFRLQGHHYHHRPPPPPHNHHNGPGFSSGRLQDNMDMVHMGGFNGPPRHGPDHTGFQPHGHEHGHHGPSRGPGGW
ncbi:hypothetical protein BDW62DRAFT_181732 [Aspergillus aurantiobrunneus]